MTDPLASDSNIHCEHLGFSRERISLPSKEENDEGKAKHDPQTHGCNTQHHPTQLGAQPQLEHTETVEEDEFWPLSAKPYFHCILAKSHVSSRYQMVVPPKMHSSLPQVEVPVVLSCRNKSWEMKYYGDRSYKRFDPGWRKFANDNNLKVGDGCVFELMENNNEGLKFRVQILSGEIPSEFIDRVDGNSSNTPIIIE